MRNSGSCFAATGRFPKWQCGTKATAAPLETSTRTVYDPYGQPTFYDGSCRLILDRPLTKSHKKNGALAGCQCALEALS